tara:strand:- start:776 stop:1429 length:654 start_codon:yes stop_codon:yes gene_type:complete
MNVTDFTFKLYTVAQGACLYHIYTECYGPTGFNGSGLGMRRFDPIKSAKGAVIPSYYAAYSDLVAIQETIARQNDKGSSKLTWRRETAQQIIDKQAQGIAQITTTRELQLIDLETVRYTSLNKTIQHLLRKGNTAYPMLWEIAKFFINNHPQYDGLIWDSYQRDIKGERAMVLWGHKVKSTDLACERQEHINTAANLDRLRDALRAIGAPIPPWLIK